MPFCTQCGHQNPDGARFCSQCGSRLETAAATSGGHESPSESTATITFGGPVKEAEHRDERALGDAESEIFLDDVTVSRRHAEFRRTADGYTVADVGSLNGTYVNRDRIDEVALQGGDEVQIGKYRLVYFASHSGAGQ